VALDDLVEPLAGQRPAAEVDEQLRLVALADQLRPAAAQVAGDRGDRLATERHQPFLRALAAGPQQALAQIDIAQLQPDRLRGPQPTGVHRLQQRPVAERRRLVAARGGQQLLHLGVVEDLGQLLRPPRRAERGGRVVADQLVTAQVLVERAQAGGLAVDRRGRAGRAVPLPGRQLGEELGDVGRSRLQRVALVGGEELAVLEEVGAVGVERVAGQAPLQLQVGEDVEDDALAHPRGSSPPTPPARDADSALPAARGAAKNRGSSLRSRPIVRDGRPLVA
jgi:hypothetical protein